MEWWQRAIGGQAMRSKSMPERASLVLITLVVLSLAAIGMWALAAGSPAMEANAAGPVSMAVSARAYSSAPP